MPTRIEIGIDSVDPERLAPFWAAALGYEVGDPTLPAFISTSFPAARPSRRFLATSTRAANWQEPFPSRSVRCEPKGDDLGTPPPRRRRKRGAAERI